MEETFFICPKCGNKDPKYIGFKNGKPYCRKCIAFKGEASLEKERYPKKAPIIINYELSKEQKELSASLLLNFKSGVNTLVNAVCGSGKTEIVLELISYVIKCGERVGFSVPRKDVAAELAERFKSIFKYNKVVAIYGGHHDELEGDLIILTTHQLYRYEKYFDLLILDEIDAFPFANNDLLNAFFFRSIKRNFVMLSATPNEATISYFKQDGHAILNLNKRFHNHFLPVPKVIICKNFLMLYFLYKTLKNFINNKKQVFIFAPTIEIAEKTFAFLHLFIKNGMIVHSKRKDRSEIINDFRNKKYMYLVTTAVLERGVTVKDLQVIVFFANHQIYDSAALIQIAGRAGRKKDAPEGEVIYIASENNEEIRKSIDKIECANSDL